ncbi:MAG: CBS domain-containing protein [Thioclava marina]|uniref:Histidine kinase n=1 Tax=Thioclava marina TaxID=1915077 RepID=A0ABX3MHR8_9RHOB|nr:MULTISPECIES: CBS domain-containing protein [Thioclava]TNE93666.1 MAG: CBS domain-containing protein [Paracoccaceae bacterium]MBC7144813.1 CBS domain-containing protein [Thioclava marina]MBD3802079.1 CBS domain-containing protein [Thioclava sp.]OOY11083.1 histidine kinase [Thioclava marina]OOY27143.1 histidine kinase [Thioclava sp. L04-15]
MQVMQILKEKGQGGVYTVSPDMKLSDVIAALSSKRIGAVIVSTDGETVEGIVSERDVVREIARRGAACLTLRASEVMTREVSCCAPMDSTEAVMEQMTEGRFRHMPVKDKGKMVGVISIGDVVKARLGELHMEKESLQGMIMGN